MFVYAAELNIYPGNTVCVFVTVWRSQHNSH